MVPSIWYDASESLGGAARGMVGDGQRIAVASVAELELALEVGAPKRVGRLLSQVDVLAMFFSSAIARSIASIVAWICTNSSRISLV